MPSKKRDKNQSPKILGSKLRALEDNKNLKKEQKIRENLERFRFEQSLSSDIAKIRFDTSLNVFRLTGDWRTHYSVISLYLPIRISKKEWLRIEGVYQLVWILKHILNDEEWLKFVDMIRNVVKTQEKT